MNILWDFDGTLFDTYPAMVRLFITHFVPDREIDPAEALAKMKISFKHAFEYYGLSIDQSYERLHELELAIPPEEKPPFPHVREALAAADLNVIVTHKSGRSVETILDYYQMGAYFREVITMDDGFKRKPDPEAYRYLHAKYGLDLVIGDRELDLIPARILGIKTCAFQNPELDADYHLNSYADFKHVIAHFRK